MLWGRIGVRFAAVESPCHAGVRLANCVCLRGEVRWPSELRDGIRKCFNGLMTD
jgi:hypothetical protein